jgi:hypothetical protein
VFFLEHEGRTALRGGQHLRAAGGAAGGTIAETNMLCYSIGVGRLGSRLEVTSGSQHIISVMPSLTGSARCGGR